MKRREIEEPSLQNLDMLVFSTSRKLFPASWLIVHLCRQSDEELDLLST